MSTHAADSARELARRVDGRFGTQPVGEVEMDLAESAGTQATRPTRQVESPLVHHSLSPANRRSDDVVRSIERGETILDAPYQRGSVWSEDQRVGLVRSWVTGVPIPSVLVNDRTTGRWRRELGEPDPDETGQGQFAVVDGRQRLETACDWYGDRLAVPASWFPVDDVEETVDTEDGPYVYNGGLTLSARRRFANRASIPVVTAQVESVHEEADLYLLVNGGGTAQSEDDMANAARVADQR